MKKLILLPFLVLLLISCSNKKNIVHDPIKNELLAYTEKFEKIRTGSDRYLAIMTYLNPILKTDSEDEVFILSSYPKEEIILLDTLKVNGNKSLIILELKDNDKILEFENINLPWSHKYKIIAPKQNSNHLTITYDTNRSLKVVLKFQKISKSMYWNPQIVLESK